MHVHPELRTLQKPSRRGGAAHNRNVERPPIHWHFRAPIVHHGKLPLPQQPIEHLVAVIIADMQDIIRVKKRLKFRAQFHRRAINTNDPLQPLSSSFAASLPRPWPVAEYQTSHLSHKSAKSPLQSEYASDRSPSRLRRLNKPLQTAVKPQR